MESNVDTILSNLFSALQVFDPTNYIENVPHAPPNETNYALNTQPMTETHQLPANVNVPEAQPAVAVPVPVPTGGGDKTIAIEGESPPSVTNAAAIVIPGPGIPIAEAASGAGEAPVEELRSCAICLDDVPVSDYLVLGPCAHGFCRDCLTAQAVHAARSGTAPVNCASCSVPLDGPGLLSLLSPDDAARLDAALAQALAGPVRYCSACGEAVAGQDGVGEFTCPRCSYVNPAAEDALAALAEQKGWIPCPGCGNLASKADSWSCNFTTCFCGVSFCLRCGARYAPAKRQKRNDDEGDTNNNGAGPSSVAGGASSSEQPPRPASPNQHGYPTCQCGLYERDQV